MELGVNIVPCAKEKCRKRSIQKEKWKRNINKLSRHKPTQLPEYPKCNHRGEKCPYLCRTLTMPQVKKFHEMLFQTTDKIKQDLLILKYCLGSKPKRSKTVHHSVSIKYHVSVEGGTLIRVCKKAFLGISNFSANRIERVVRNFVLHSQMPKENRGGDRINERNDIKKESMKTFIESINYVESHYCRSKSSSRMYLPCTLNFTKLHKMYSEKYPTVPVKLGYFRAYVNSNYNIAFGTPMTDVCSTCLKAKESIKNALTLEEKVQIITEQRVHTLKAKAFYNLLKTEEDNVQTFSFDCQKNLALPKLPDQAAYFSQQINYYNLTIVKGSSKSKLTPNNVFSYLWAETDSPKDSNSIVSAIHNLLNNSNFSDTINTVRLFADGCGGQNKNSVMMSMIGHWLALEAPAHIKTVEFIFPIVGHSFIPPDRIFGLIEKEVRKVSVIISKEEYEEIIKNHSTIKKIGRDWRIFDWKEETKKFTKVPGQWHFKFNPSKRFIFSKGINSSIKVRGEAHYRADLCEGKGILKRNKKFDQFQPKLLNIRNKLKGDKSTIDSLLKKHYGEDWRQDPKLAFYKIIDQSGPTADENEDEPDYNESEEDTDMRI